MNDLMLVEKLANLEKLKALVLDSVSSPITKRVYNMALNEFLAWFQQAPGPGFTAWRISLEERRLGSSSIIIRMSAIRKLAAEAADNGLLAPELAAGISRVKSAKCVGIRVGNWLSDRQTQALLNAPNIATVRGLRDRAILAVLFGCGLRRSEVAALTLTHVQLRDGRWCVVDLVGKHGRVRTVPMPNWVKVAIDSWTSAAGLTDGYVFRPISRAIKCWANARVKRWCGRCSGSARRPPGFLASRLMTLVRRAQNCVGRRAASWNRFKCS